MPLVLAIEPDPRQAAIVKRIVREKVLADVTVVDSREAALEAIRTTVPDVLLISALLSPRDEDELVAHLRTLDNADHLQTHTIPQLASALGPGEGRASRGLLSAFRRKKESDAAPAGCDPDMFAEEIRSYLQRAAEKKREHLDDQALTGARDHTWRTATHGQKAADPVAEPPAADASASSWSSPFEWKPSNPASVMAPAASIVASAPVIEKPASSIVTPASVIGKPASSITTPAAVVAKPSSSIVNAGSLMAHLRPPAGIPSVADLSVAVQADGPMRAAGPLQTPAPIERLPAVIAPAPSPVARRTDSPMPDSGLGIRDQRSGKRQPRPGALSSWARAEHPGREAAQEGDDLRGLLTNLAVPSAVVAVSYGRGCRIRRVRVPAARQPGEAEPVGAVVLSKRLPAERRERRDQPPA